MLGRSLRQEGAPHDCEQDAAAAMQLVNHALQHGMPAPLTAPEIKVSVCLTHCDTLRGCLHDTLYHSVRQYLWHAGSCGCV